jgi:hypothetical protein
MCGWRRWLSLVQEGQTRVKGQKKVTPQHGTVSGNCTGDLTSLTCTHVDIEGIMQAAGAANKELMLLTWPVWPYRLLNCYIIIITIIITILILMVGSHSDSRTYSRRITPTTCIRYSGKLQAHEAPRYHPLPQCRT